MFSRICFSLITVVAAFATEARALPGLDLCKRLYQAAGEYRSPGFSTHEYQRQRTNLSIHRIDSIETAAAWMRPFLSNPQLIDQFQANAKPSHKRKWLRKLRRFSQSDQINQRQVEALFRPLWKMEFGDPKELLNRGLNSEALGKELGNRFYEFHSWVDPAIQDLRRRGRFKESSWQNSLLRTWQHPISQLGVTFGAHYLAWSNAIYLPVYIPYFSRFDPRADRDSRSQGQRFSFDHSYHSLRRNVFVYLGFLWAAWAISQQQVDQRVEARLQLEGQKEAIEEATKGVSEIRKFYGQSVEDILFKKWLESQETEIGPTDDQYQEAWIEIYREKAGEMWLEKHGEVAPF